MLKEAALLLDPDSFPTRSTKYHHRKLRLNEFLRNRPPLFLFAGDEGTGKTALAETFGDAKAHEADIRVMLCALSLNTHGTGAVGETTSLLSAAFAAVKQAALRATQKGSKHS